jgi:hypothetical protein
MIVASRISMKSADAAISAIRVGLPAGGGAGFEAGVFGAGAGPSSPAPDVAGRVTVQLRKSQFLARSRCCLELFPDFDPRVKTLAFRIAQLTLYNETIERLFSRLGHFD